MAAAGLLARSEYERKHFVTDHYRVQSLKIPEDFDGYRMVFLADLHNNSFGSGNGQLLDAIREAGDVWLATGSEIAEAYSKKH